MKWQRLVWMAAILASASSTGATVVAGLTLDQAVELSAEVVVGRVLSTETRQDARGAIHTDATVLVEECLRGCQDAGTTRVVRQPGGLLAGLGCHVAGAPRFEPEERVLLFLDRAPGGVMRSVGLYQGAYTLEQTDDGPIALQKPSGDSLMLAPPSGDPLPRRVELAPFAVAIRRSTLRP